MNSRLDQTVERVIRSQELGDERSTQRTAPQNIPQSYGLVVYKDDKILLVKPRGEDFWEIPKGGLDGKEAPKKAAERETKEETGITAKPKSTLGYAVDEDWNDGEGKVVYTWLADYESGLVDEQSDEAVRIQKSEVEQAKFFEPDEALDLVPDYLKLIIKRAIVKRSVKKSESKDVYQVVDLFVEEKVKKFITDMGQSYDITNDLGTEETTQLPRYGVWGDTGRGKAEVIDTGDDLEALMSKHNIPKDLVVKL